MAIVRLHQKTGGGNLDEAISSCRQAIYKWPGAYEALFWEGLCHQEAERPAKAANLFECFITKARMKGKYRKFASEAEANLKKYDHSNNKLHKQ